MQPQPLFEPAFGMLGAEDIFRLGHPADYDRDTGVNDEHLEPLRCLGHDLSAVGVKKVVKLVHDDQLHAAVIQKPHCPVGQCLYGAAGPGRIAQCQEEICGDPLRPGVGLQCDFENRCSVPVSVSRGG